MWRISPRRVGLIVVDVYRRNPRTVSTSCFRHIKQQSPYSSTNNPRFNDIVVNTEKSDKISSAANFDIIGNNYKVNHMCPACHSTQYIEVIKQSYHRGCVLVKCPTCSHLDLFSDCIGYFKSLKACAMELSKFESTTYAKKYIKVEKDSVIQIVQVDFKSPSARATSSRMSDFWEASEWDDKNAFKRRQFDDGDNHVDSTSIEQEDNIPAIVKRKKPAPPPGGPKPRWRSPNREGSSDEEKSHERGDESENVDSMGQLSLDKPIKKRGVSIEDMIDDEPQLTVNLDEDSDEEKLDFKAEKRRYANDAKAQSERERIENSKSKPPLAPPKSLPPRLTSESPSASHKSGPTPSRSAGADVDPDFLNEDWDDVDSPPKNKGKPNVHTGSQADSNWLDEDFDD